MSQSQKLLLGFVLGFAGYVAYKKLQRTKTVIVNTIDTPVPSVLNVANMAGRR